LNSASFYCCGNLSEIINLGMYLTIFPFCVHAQRLSDSPSDNEDKGKVRIESHLFARKADNRYDT